MSTDVTRLSEHLYVHHGHVNTGILSDGNRALLIDPSGSALQATLDALGITKITHAVFTHHHRDNAAGFPLPASTRIGVPEKEAAWFTDVETFWNDPKQRWHLYNYRPHNLMRTEPLPVAVRYVDGDRFEWGHAALTVLETPGHTDGSVTYLVDVDRQRFAFSGDLIYDAGELWELYSLQKGTQTSDYHGFLGARDDLAESLEKLRSTTPTALVPTHGTLMRTPDTAIETLLNRLTHCYDNYVSISALRYYFPKLFTEFEGSPGHLPIRAGKPPPDFLRHFGTTWVIRSETGEAFVMDCGAPHVIKHLQQLHADGDISAVTQFWITHYHDDHVDSVPEFQATFPCETITDAVVSRVITQPLGFRIPCISPAVARIDRTTQDGDSWRWNEFTMTAYHFPGQTYYHGGLLVEGHGLRLFFSGDSFTMAGIDDYCAGNRNLLGETTGYMKCLRLLQQLKPTHIFNCHVDPAFDFTDAEIQQMLETLAEREKCLTDLFPWDHANYGTDEHWVRCYPYEQEVRPGETAHLRVEITNHSAHPRTAQARPILPATWELTLPVSEVTIPPKTDGHIAFSVPIPVDAPHGTGRLVIPIEMTYDARPLGQFREAILVLTGD